MGSVGEKYLPPQDVSLACGLFRAENNQGPKKTQEEALAFPLTA